MEAKTFKQVFIKSESDLPKEEGYYFVKFKQKGDPKIYADTYQSHHFGDGDKRDAVWLDCIDWYLQPIEKIEDKTELIVGINFFAEDLDKEEQKLERTAEEIFDSYKVNFGKFDREFIIILMNKYHNQFTQREVADEEIEKEFPISMEEDIRKITDETLSLNDINNGKRFGAKWYRSQLKLK